jgi:hypothetical protein
LAFDVSLVREIQVAAVGLRLASKGVFQALLRLGAFQLGHGFLLTQVNEEVAPKKLGDVATIVGACARVQLFKAMLAIGFINHRLIVDKF